MENGMDKYFVREEWNWSISCLNDSESKEKGRKRVKIQNISRGIMSPDILSSFGACLWNRSVFIVDPRLNEIAKPTRQKVNT